jgi:hypothetical protein
MSNSADDVYALYCDDSDFRYAVIPTSEIDDAVFDYRNGRGVEEANGNVEGAIENVAKAIAEEASAIAEEENARLDVPFLYSGGARETLRTIVSPY